MSHGGNVNEKRRKACSKGRRGVMMAWMPPYKYIHRDRRRYDTRFTLASTVYTYGSDHPAKYKARSIGGKRGSVVVVIMAMGHADRCSEISPSAKKRSRQMPVPLFLFPDGKQLLGSVTRCGHEGGPWVDPAQNIHLYFNRVVCPPVPEVGPVPQVQRRRQALIANTQLFRGEINAFPRKVLAQKKKTFDPVLFFSETRLYAMVPRDGRV
jgi:hypothetical protein